MPLILSDEEKRNRAYSYASPQARVNAVAATATRKPVQKNRTLDDLEKDEEFQFHAARWLEATGNREEDIFETLRDSDWNLYHGVKRAMDAPDWSPEAKESYAYIRSQFDNADTGSLNQWINATKDIGIDLISDPTSIVALLASPWTGGASLAGRQAAATAAKGGIKALTSNAVARSVVGGAAFTTVDDWARQKVEESVGLRDNISGAQMIAMAAAGGALGGLGAKLLTPRNLNKTARALSSGQVQEQARIMFGERGAHTFIAKTVGKPAGLLDPYTKVSKTAADLQQMLRYDLGREWSNPLTKDVKKVAKKDFHQTLTNKTGKYWQEVMQAIEPISINRTAKLEDAVNDELLRAVRTGKSNDQSILQAAQKVRKVLDDMWMEQGALGLVNRENIVRRPSTMYNKSGVLTKAGRDWVALAKKHGVDPNTTKEIKWSAKADNYFPRQWNRKALEKNGDRFKELLIQVGEAKDMSEANSILTSMLDKKDNLATPAGHLFNAKRTFQNITDDSLFDEFLDNDFTEVMFNYVTQASKKMSSVETFGVKSLDEFNDTFIEKISQDMKAAGMKLSKAEKQNIQDLYKYATGEGIEYLDGKLGVLKDWTALGYQVSMLPLATLSSLTEVVLPLTKSGIGPVGYSKALVQGMGAGMKQITIDLLDTFRIKHGMSKPKAFRELNRFMIALDQGLADGVERLSGEALRTSLPKKIQNQFFKANFLTQWTKAVQATAYISGKDLITDNLTRLSKMKNYRGRSAVKMINELADLGVDYHQGVQWIKNGRKLDDPFYDSIMQGAVTFTNEVIIPTAREAGTKPHIMSNPKMDIFFQFMGYPAAFTNVVLKNIGKTAFENPGATPKIVAAGVMMTAMARWGNWVRSGGASEEEGTEWEKNLKAIARWGGNGLAYDMIQRGAQTAQATGSPLGFAAGFAGPIVGEAVTSVAYRKWPVEILAPKVIGVGAAMVPGAPVVMGLTAPEYRDDMNTWLRAQDEKIKEILGINKSKSKEYKMP